LQARDVGAKVLMHPGTQKRTIPETV